MPKNQDYQTPPIMMSRLRDNFGEIDYTVPLNGPFEVAPLLQAMQMEAGAKQMGIVIQVTLAPLELFFGVPETEEPNDRPERENDQPGGSAS